MNAPGHVEHVEPEIADVGPALPVDDHVVALAAREGLQVGVHLGLASRSFVES